MEQFRLSPILRLPVGLLTLVGGAALGGCASYEFDVSAAYAELRAADETEPVTLVDDSDGYRLAANASRSLLTPGFVRAEGGNGLRMNVNLSSSAYDQDVSSDGIALTGGDAGLWVLSPQVGPSFRLSLGSLFVEPGITGGAAYGQLDADYTTASGETIDDDETDFSWAYRPYIRAGYVNRFLILGVEGGYEETGLDFDLGSSGEYSSWYVGGFVGFRLTR